MLCYSSPQAYKKGYIEGSSSQHKVSHTTAYDGIKDVTCKGKKGSETEDREWRLPFDIDLDF